MPVPSLQLAVELAAQAHRGMFREGETQLPYVTHPMEVLMHLRYAGGVTDLEMLCAAVLHDTVEAEALSLDLIEKEFGARVRSLVDELTRKEPTSAETARLNKDEIWELRASMLVNEVAAMSADAQQIKLADRLANLRDAYRLKKGKKLRRYQGQTRRILDVVPRERNKGLWDAINQELNRE